MTRHCSRRRFLGLAASAPLAMATGCGGSDDSPANATPSPTPPTGGGPATVALTRCRSYGTEAFDALRQSFDRLGGIGSLVRDRVVAVKVNFTGWPYRVLFGQPPGETYITHGDTALALAQLLSEAGARRIRFVESVPNHYGLDWLPDIGHQHKTGLLNKRHQSRLANQIDRRGGRKVVFQIVSRSHGRSEYLLAVDCHAQP